MFRSLGPLAFPKSPGAEWPLEELAQDAGRLASWSISRFPAGDLGMSGLFLSETEENGGGGRGTVLWRALPFCSSALPQQGQTRQDQRQQMPFSPPPSISLPNLLNSSSLTTPSDSPPPH